MCALRYCTFFEQCFICRVHWAWLVYLQLAYHISGEFVPKEKLNRTTFKGWKQTFKPTAQVAAVKRVNSFKTDEQVVE